LEWTPEIEYKDTLRRRIETVLLNAVAAGHKHIILGTLESDPETIAEVYSKVIFGHRWGLFFSSIAFVTGEKDSSGYGEFTKRLGFGRILA